MEMKIREEIRRTRQEDLIFFSLSSSSLPSLFFFSPGWHAHSLAVTHDGWISAPDGCQRPAHDQCYDDPAGPFYAFFGVRHYFTKIIISTKFLLQGSILEKCDFVWQFLCWRLIGSEENEDTSSFSPWLANWRNGRIEGWPMRWKQKIKKSLFTI